VRRALSETSKQIPFAIAYGEESLDGVRTTRYRGRVALDEVAAGFGRRVVPRVPPEGEVVTVAELVEAAE
jgi:hypothetical protein